MKNKAELCVDVSNILKQHNIKAKIRSDFDPKVGPHTNVFYLHLSYDERIVLVSRKPYKYTDSAQSLMIKYNIKQSELNNLTKNLVSYYTHLIPEELSLIDGVSIVNE